MSKNAIMKLGAAVCTVALSGAMLAGCANSAANNAATAEQQAGRAYMSQVNETMAELDEGLDSFVAAVSRNDLVNMRSQAENAYQALEKLGDIEAPEAYEDVQKHYVDGTGKLREALDDYIALYTDMNGASFDQSTYDKRIADIQKLYDDGVSDLEEGDKAASEIE